MPGFLIGTSYGVSAGLVIFAIVGHYAPQGSEFGLLMGEAGAGLLLSFYAVARARKEPAK